MTRKDYLNIAKALKTCFKNPGISKYSTEITRIFTGILSKDNRAFSPQLFQKEIFEEAKVDDIFGDILAKRLK